MVRKRGVARTSFARRRVRRVKKYDHNVIPLRFKVQLPDMADRLKPPLNIHVECEVPTMELLETLNVPTAEWVYYLGFMKRMVELYRNFTSETLQSEKDSLISEYVLRGKDKNVLEQVQTIAEVCVGIVVSCTEVKACLEGNYTNWTYQWQQNTTTEPMIFYVNEPDNYLWTRDIVREFDRWQLSDGTLLTTLDTLEYPFNASEFRFLSVLSKYFAFVDDEGGVPVLKVYKDGVVQQTLDLNALCGWTDVGPNAYITSMTYDGKYIMVYCFDATQIALFKGS